VSVHTQKRENGRTYGEGPGRSVRRETNVGRFTLDERATTSRRGCEYRPGARSTKTSGLRNVRAEISLAERKPSSTRPAEENQPSGGTREEAWNNGRRGDSRGKVGQSGFTEAICVRGANAGGTGHVGPVIEAGDSLPRTRGRTERGGLGGLAESPSFRTGKRRVYGGAEGEHFPQSFSHGHALY